MERQTFGGRTMIETHFSQFQRAFRLKSFPPKILELNPLYHLTQPLKRKTFLEKDLITFFFFKGFVYFPGEGNGWSTGRETLISVSCTPQPGTCSTTQARALTGGRTGDLLVCRMTTNPLSHTSQDLLLSFKRAGVSYLQNTNNDVYHIIL